MKYLIERTSCFYDEDPHVEGSYPVDVHYIYTRKTRNCPESITNSCINIRNEDGVWIGESKEPMHHWAIDINSLEELNAFIKEVGHPVIMFERNNVEGLWGLEIYDSYRE